MIDVKKWNHKVQGTSWPAVNNSKKSEILAQGQTEKWWACGFMGSFQFTFLWLLHFTVNSALLKIALWSADKGTFPQDTFWAISTYNSLSILWKLAVLCAT